MQGLADRCNTEGQLVRVAYLSGLQHVPLACAATQDVLCRARYLNHSCDPNCSTQKWIVGGETRVGIFTKRRCTAGEELTYDYNLEWNGFARIKCVTHYFCQSTLSQLLSSLRKT